MSSAIASTLASLDHEWYSQALGLPVSAVELEAVPFTGATTDLARVHLSYAEESQGPSSLIAKLTGGDELRRAMDAAMGLFAREARFYREFAALAPVRTPACFFAGDGTSTPLLLEDLATLRMGDQIEGLAFDDAERIIDALAELHARFWQSPATGSDWLLDPANELFTGMVAQLVGSGRDALGERFAGTVPDATLAAVLEHASHWQTLLLRGAEGPKTIAHYDCRLDNIFFGADGTPTFIDWQAVAAARGTQDVANLLPQSMEVDVLQPSWLPLLHRYHDGLVDRGVQGYSWDQCQEHYRQNVFYALGAGMALMGAMDIGDGRGLGETIVVRTLHHIDDIDAFGAI